MPMIAVLVANASEACLYSTQRIGGDLECVDTFAHPASREKGMDLTSDRPGHNKSKGLGHGALVESQAPKTTESEQFARELAASLDVGRIANRYERLVLVAPAHFMGQIKKHCHHLVLDRVVLTLEKDYTKATTAALATHLEANRP